MKLLVAFGLMVGGDGEVDTVHCLRGTGVDRWKPGIRSVDSLSAPGSTAGAVTEERGVSREGQGPRSSPPHRTTFGCRFHTHRIPVELVAPVLPWVAEPQVNEWCQSPSFASYKHRRHFKRLCLPSHLNLHPPDCRLDQTHVCRVRQCTCVENDN